MQQLKMAVTILYNESIENFALLSQLWTHFLVLDYKIRISEAGCASASGGMG
jgi:hypothetical protein